MGSFKSVGTGRRKRETPGFKALCPTINFSTKAKAGKKYCQTGNSSLMSPLEGFCVTYFEKEHLLKIMRVRLLTEAAWIADLIILR